MTNPTLLRLLRKLGACSEACAFVASQTLTEAWETCPRADGLLWLCARQIGVKGWPTRRQLVLAACACAETALQYVPPEEKRPAKALEMARKWARGEATLQEVRGAARAAYAYAYAAYDIDAAIYAAAYAAYAAIYAAAYAATDDAYAAANAAANAVYAFTRAAAAAAYAARAPDATPDADAAYTKAHLEMAAIIRRMLTIPS